MKKTVLFSAAILAVSAVSAQTGEITSNRGENWLSQSGDWGLTFDAQPMLNYVGNLFNGSTSNNNTNSLTWANSMFAIQGKKLIDANTAYRGKVRIGFGSSKVTTLVPQIGATDPNATVEDSEKIGGTNIVLGAGIEKRVGSTRVVGVYGAEALIGLGSGKTTYEYGNALAANNPVSRMTEMKNGSTFMIGVGIFGGIEWFCAPKISLSGEYTWGLAFSSTGEGSSTTEFWNGTGVETTESKTGKSSSFGIDTGVTGASVGINFYFQ